MPPVEALPILTPAEARVLGCLIEKKELTPDIYPLSLNAAVVAANQKTAREPVMALEEIEVNRALKTLAEKGLVRQVFGSRVDRHEHLMAQRFSLTQGQAALVGLLLLRGPQTAHELHARAERMARFASVDAVKSDLDLLIGRRPPLVQLLERAPGQREERYAQLFGGPVEAAAPIRATWQPTPPPGLETRVAALEEEVAALKAEIAALKAR